MGSNVPKAERTPDNVLYLPDGTEGTWTQEPDSFPTRKVLGLEESFVVSLYWTLTSNPSGECTTLYEDSGRVAGGEFFATREQGVGSWQRVQGTTRVVLDLQVTSQSWEGPGGLGEPETSTREIKIDLTDFERRALQRGGGPDVLTPTEVEYIAPPRNTGHSGRVRVPRPPFVDSNEELDDELEADLVQIASGGMTGGRSMKLPTSE